jgi:carboxyl-terminal processing protease
MTPDKIASRIRGAPGTTVHLRVAREGQSEPLDFDISRASLDVPDVSWGLLPGMPIAHIVIQNFGKQAHAQLKAALQEATRRGARALILDVRGNPGGLKDQAVAVTSEFLREGTVFIEQDATGKQNTVPVTPGGTATDIPLCVLIDEGTSSSSEIFAGAIQDHKRGQLVGVHTFGTGTVLMPFTLSDHSAVLLAIAEWLTPNGRKIWHVGISPDVAVVLPVGAAYLRPDQETALDATALARSEDKQLLKAVEILKSAIDGSASKDTNPKR